VRFSTKEKSHEQKPGREKDDQEGTRQDREGKEGREESQERGKKAAAVNQAVVRMGDPALDNRGGQILSAHVFSVHQNPARVHRNRVIPFLSGVRNLQTYSR
jgi:hypothetical protein